MCVYVCIFSVYMYTCTCWLHLAINVPKCNTVYSVLQYSSVINISTRHGGVWCLVHGNIDIQCYTPWHFNCVQGNCHALRPKETLNHMFVEDAVQAVKAFQASGARLGGKEWSCTFVENLWGIISFPFSVIFVLLVFLPVDVQSSSVTFGKLCENVCRHWHPWNCFSLGWRFDKFPWIMGSPLWCWSQLTHLISSQMMDIFLW